MELISRKQAVMMLHGIEDEDKAQSLLDEIKKDNELSPIVINEVPTTDEDGEEEES